MPCAESQNLRRAVVSDNPATKATVVINPDDPHPISQLLRLLETQLDNHIVDIRRCEVGRLRARDKVKIEMSDMSRQGGKVENSCNWWARTQMTKRLGGKRSQTKNRQVPRWWDDPNDN